MNLFKSAVLAGALAFGALAAACSAPSAPGSVNVAEEQRSIEALEDSWDEYWGAGDLEGLVNTYYTPDAILAATGQPEYRGREAILGNYSALKTDPNLELDYRPADLTVAASGDLAVRSGTYSNRYTDPATRQVASDSGRYVVVYRKDQDGQWRAAIDIETSLSP